MRQDNFNTQTADMSLYFGAHDAAVPSHQETLGEVVMEILKSGMTVNRQTICAKLMSRQADVKKPDHEKHHNELIPKLIGRKS